MSKRKAYVSIPRHNGERFAKLMVGQFKQMSDTFQYCEEIDLQKIVDEQARKLQRRVDEATLDKVADTLANFGYVKADGNNRWFQLFGTPERAARTLASIVIADGCVDCALLDATCCRNKDTWLEWLKG